VPEWIEGAFRLAVFLSFFGRIVSLLGLRRRLPSVRPDTERSWLLIDAWAMEGTVSVSTVIFRDATSARALLVVSVESEGFDERVVFGRWAVEAERISCILG
jgi:hypothetical protein